MTSHEIERVTTRAPRLQRSVGNLRIGVGAGAALTDLFQEGALRGRLPRPAQADCLEAVVINLAGGMTGGDRYRVDVDVTDGGRATVVGQACEKIYRSAGDTARLDVTLRVAAGSRLAWLPQPAIVFDGADFERRLDVDLAPGASLFAVEGTVLGRSAMGETVSSLRLREHWRVRRGDELLWASAGRLDLPTDPAAAVSALGEATAWATMLRVGGDPERDLDAFRTCADAVRGRLGASRIDDCVVATLVASDPRYLLEDIALVAGRVDETRVPRVWHC